MNLTSKEFLRQLKKLDKLIENKLIERKQWEDLALNISPAPFGTDRVQTSNNKGKIERAVVECLDIEIGVVEATVKQYIKTKEEVLKVIEQLEEREYDLVHKVYVQFKDLVTVADEMNISYSLASTIHQSALADIQKILDKL